MVSAFLLAAALHAGQHGGMRHPHWTECVFAPGVAKHCWHFPIRHPRGVIVAQRKTCRRTGPVTICITFPVYGDKSVHPPPPPQGTPPQPRPAPLRGTPVGPLRITCYDLPGVTANNVHVGWGILASDLFPFGARLTVDLPPPYADISGVVEDHTDGKTDVDVWRPGCAGFPTGTWPVYRTG